MLLLQILKSKCQEFTEGKVVDESHPTNGEEHTEMVCDEQRLPEPFISPKSGATVTIDNSIALLNRYNFFFKCQSFTFH